MNRLRLLISTFAAVLVMLPGAKAQNAYVANSSASVSVIDTSRNTVVAPVVVGAGPFGTGPFAVAITPTRTVLLSAVSAKLDISSAGFVLNGSFTLGAGGAINPTTQPLTLRVETYTATVPAGSFNAGLKGRSLSRAQPVVHYG